MRLLVVLAHPSPDSLCAAAARAAVAAGLAAGHQADLWDLQAEGYDPVMRLPDWHDHMRGGGGGDPADLARLARAEALILIYPTWWGGPPALLKGWFDKVWRPGTAYHLDAMTLRPGLTALRHLGVVTTHGGPWWAALLAGQPGRRTILRSLRVCAPRQCRVAWQAIYRVGAATADQRAAFLQRVGARVGRVR